MTPEFPLALRPALRAATPIPLPEETVESCLDLNKPADVLFDRAHRVDLSALSVAERRSTNPVTAEVAESVAEVVLAEVGLSVFWHITAPGIRGVDRPR